MRKAIIYLRATFILFSLISFFACNREESPCPNTDEFHPISSSERAAVPYHGRDTLTFVNGADTVKFYGKGVVVAKSCQNIGNTPGCNTALCYENNSLIFENRINSTTIWVGIFAHGTFGTIPSMQNIRVWILDSYKFNFAHSAVGCKTCPGYIPFITFDGQEYIDVLKVYRERHDYTKPQDTLSKIFYNKEFGVIRYELSNGDTFTRR